MLVDRNLPALLLLINENCVSFDQQDVFTFAKYSLSRARQTDIFKVSWEMSQTVHQPLSGLGTNIFK